VRTRRFVDLEGHDAYQLIGVPSSASAAEIRHAYRRVMLTAHPDMGGPEQLAKLINCARDALLQDREAYDKYRERLAARSAATANSQQTDHDEGLPDPEDAAVPQPAWAEGGSAEDHWTDEDWTDEDWADEDPWEDAEEGVGAPGAGADAPGAVGEPDDDQPYRPYQPVDEPSLWDRLTTPPVLILGALVLGLIVAGISGQGGASQTSGLPVPRITSNFTMPAPIPTRFLPSDLAPTVNPLSSLLATPLLTPPRLSVLLKPGHRCTVRANDSLWCSGANDYGQLGVGTTAEQATAKQVKGAQRWRSVTVGTDHTCAIRSDRTLWCWGSNSAGQLGVGSKKDSSVPRQVAGNRRWLSVGAAVNETCAVTTSHTLWCWGSSSVLISSVGNPIPASSTTPKRYGKGITWLTVRASDSSLCVHRPRHQDICWFSLFPSSSP